MKGITSVGRLRIVIFSVIIVLFLFTTSCSDNTGTESQNKSHSTFTINIVDPVESLDPLKIIYTNDWLVNSLLYEGLVGYTDDFTKVEPLIAESWEISEDGLTYRFKLRDNVYFHDDACFNNQKRSVTADDILYTFERLANKNSGNIYWSLFQDKIIGINDFHNGNTTNIKGIKIISPNEIEILLTKPYKTFLKVLGTPAASIVPKEAISFYDSNFKNNAVGTGPYKLGYWKELKEIFLVKNPDYWKKDKDNYCLPYIDEINICLVKNNSALLPEFRKGQSQLFVADNSIFQQLFSHPEFSRSYRYLKNNALPTVRYWGLSMDKNNALTKNKKLRQYLFQNFNPVFPDSMKNQNVIATKLLAPLNIPLHLPQRSKPEDITGSIIISSTIELPALTELNNVLTTTGIKASFNIQANGYYKHIVNDRPDIFRISMFPSFPDFEEYYSLFYSKSDKYVNFSNYKNENYDKLYEKVKFEKDDSARNTLFVKLENILQEDVPYIPISHSKPNYYVFPNTVKNFKLKYCIPDFRYIKISSADDKEN